ncbi:MAG: ABC transporter substrate-binding protein [Acidimicrobiaceae bacterium]|nr:ABC transporter substrate-binding protein [Acidimicrobiaceae bacterium]
MAAHTNRKRLISWCSPLLALVVIAASCGSDDDDLRTSQPAAVTQAEAAAAAAATGGDSADMQAAQDAPDAAAAPADETDEPGEPLVAPVDTTTTTSPPGDEAAGAPAEPKPRFGGTLRVGVEAESDGLNPAANNFAVSAYVMTYPIFDPVAYWDVNGRWIPYLAESFTPVGDGSSWQMKLREGVRFHDGTTLGAEDAIATLEAQLDDPIIALAARSIFAEDGPIEQIDDYTVQYNLNEPNARFPQQVTSQLGMLLPSEWLERALADGTLNQMPVGTGPFMIESRVLDEATTLVRNPDYWAADMVDVYLDRIEIYPITDPVIAAERVGAGDLDLIVTSNADAILTMRDADGVKTFENVRSSEDFAIMNTQTAPFDDIRARRALTFASSREAYLSLIRQGTSPVAETMFHPDLIWHNPDVRQETDDPDSAAPLVAEYCSDWPENCSDGKINIELQYSGPSVSQTRIAELLIDGWEPYFNVTEQELLQDDHITEVALGLFNVVTWQQFGEADPDNDVVWVECRAISVISINWPRHCDSERDALLYEQRASDDLDRRVEIWHEIQQRIRDSYTYIFFNHTNWAIGAADNVQNVCGQSSPTGTELFCNNQGRAQLHRIWLS